MRISSRLWRGRRDTDAYRHLQSRQARALLWLSPFRRALHGVRLPQDRTPRMHDAATIDTTADLHVASFTTIPSPADIAVELPVGDERTALVSRTRDEVRRIMSGEDDRLL